MYYISHIFIVKALISFLFFFIFKNRVSQPLDSLVTLLTTIIYNIIYQKIINDILKNYCLENLYFILLDNVIYLCSEKFYDFVNLRIRLKIMCKNKYTAVELSMKLCF